MSMEGFPDRREKKSDAPKISMEEWKEHCGGGVNLDSEEQKQWMAEKGIKFDGGVIEIELDGEKRKMQTSKEDFGTWVDEQEEGNN